MKQLWWWGVGIVIFLMGIVFWQSTSRSAKVVMCDVGQGDSLLLTHSLSQLLVDTGPDNGGALECLGREMPFWDRHIEVIMITHADEDHVGALEAILSHFEVGQIITTTNALVDVQKIVNEKTIVSVVETGDRWQWGTVSGYVLWPEKMATSKDTNYLSLVQRVVVSPQLSLWLSGDADDKVEEKLLENGSVWPTTILKVAHHGSKTATTARFLAVLQPHQAWISVGKDNRYGHPSSSVVQELEKNGAVIRRTDLEGTISEILP